MGNRYAAFWYTSLCFLFLCLPFDIHCSEDALSEEKDPDFWYNLAREELESSLKMKPKKTVARNVILFVGDGMGVSTVTAARIYKGQRDRHPGEETVLNFEEFPYVGLSKTYSVDKQVTDSAATATALLSGVKTNMGIIGYSAQVNYEDCSALHRHNAKVDGMLKWSLEQGKSVGIVTTTRVTHATPASAYAHSASRNWESDADMAGLPDSCGKDIAYQLVMNNSGIQVILGGGRGTFLNETVPDPESADNFPNKRLDGLDLIQEWKNLHEGERAHYVSNASDFRQIDPDNTDYLFGLFSPSHIDYNLIRDSAKQPSLAEMTEKAIQILSKNMRGFFLLVEGGRIDHGHHDNLAKVALSETVAFDEAIGTAVKELGKVRYHLKNTLMIVTADHSHVFNIAGYPKRGNNIFGFAMPLYESQAPLDNLPYTTLLYATGPGPGRINLTDVNTTENFFQQSRLVPTPAGAETHGGEDVPIYARGPMAHLLHGVHQESYIAHVMAYAACAGPYRTPACRRRSFQDTNNMLK